MPPTNLPNSDCRFRNYFDCSPKHIDWVLLLQCHCVCVRARRVWETFIVYTNCLSLIWFYHRFGTFIRKMFLPRLMLLLCLFRVPNIWLVCFCVCFECRIYRLIRFQFVYIAAECAEQCGRNCCDVVNVCVCVAQDLTTVPIKCAVSDFALVFILGLWQPMGCSVTIDCNILCSRNTNKTATYWIRSFCARLCLFIK